MTTRGLALAVAAALALSALGAIAAPAADPGAPPGAPDSWLPQEEWVLEHWLPFDEADLERRLGVDRLELFGWVRTDERTLSELARSLGRSPERVMTALVSPWRHRAGPAQRRRLRRRTRWISRGRT